ncbi:flagellar biosynthesis anti-sigma factor FlgM [Pantoea dispersa]|uniref:Negative regulator of flagellin synthesis n=1 Tax=Pantoea dispersa TaxID=59814 RepID=A0ABY3A5A5_9GAMM|nr:flagellar biosynthesis anti-sigma factor FlgM [Pantoea dispersa]TQC76819.1 flagellar biosynthesis anti-sigma factor FlgM [Pantoea dispersa]
MSIDRTQTTSPVQSISTLADLRTAPSARERAEPRSVRSSDDHVSLSIYARQATADDSRDINSARLDALRAALNDGSYTLDTDQIAAALVDEMFNG